MISLMTAAQSVAIGAAAALLGIWVGYPAVIGGLAMLRPRRPTSSGEVGPTVSVVLATRESAPAILDRVRDVLAADYSSDRLDVVLALDGQAREHAAALAGFDPRVCVVDGDAPGGKACALNAGVRAARGEVLVFTDTHQRFAPDAIRRLVEALADERFGAVSGALELPDGVHGRTLSGYYWRFERWLRAAEARVHSSVGVTGAIYALRRSLWEPLPPGLILDDVYVPMQVALGRRRVGFVAAARAVDVRGTTLEQEYRRKVRTLTGNIQLCAWLPAILNPLRNPIWIQFVFHKLLRLFTPYLLLLLVVALAALSVAHFGPPSPLAVAALALLLAVALLAPTGSARRLRGLVAWGLALQAATFVAVLNGLRGRWNVWRA